MTEYSCGECRYYVLEPEYCAKFVHPTSSAFGREAKHCTGVVTGAFSASINRHSLVNLCNVDVYSMIIGRYPIVLKQSVHNIHIVVYDNDGDWTVHVAELLCSLRP
jgi:hypothetical protein